MLLGISNRQSISPITGAGNELAAKLAARQLRNSKLHRNSPGVTIINGGKEDERSGYGQSSVREETIEQRSSSRLHDKKDSNVELSQQQQHHRSVPSRNFVPLVDASPLPDGQDTSHVNNKGNTYSFPEIDAEKLNLKDILVTPDEEINSNEINDIPLTERIKKNQIQKKTSSFSERTGLSKEKMVISKIPTGSQTKPKNYVAGTNNKIASKTRSRAFLIMEENNVRDGEGNISSSVTNKPPPSPRDASTMVDPVTRNVTNKSAINDEGGNSSDSNVQILMNARTSLRSSYTLRS